MRGSENNESGRFTGSNVVLVPILSGRIRSSIPVERVKSKRHGDDWILKVPVCTNKYLTKVEKVCCFVGKSYCVLCGKVSRSCGIIFLLAPVAQKDRAWHS